jgi:hypothetical protein
MQYAIQGHHPDWELRSPTRMHSQSANVGLYTYLHHIYQCHSSPESLSPLGLIYALRELPSDVKPITGSNDSPYSLNIKPQQTCRYIPIDHLKKNFNLFPALPFSPTKAYGTPTSAGSQMLTTLLTNKHSLPFLPVLATFTHASPLPCAEEIPNRPPVSSSPAFWIIVGPMIFVLAWLLLGIVCAVRTRGNGMGWASKVGDGMMIGK